VPAQFQGVVTGSHDLCRRCVPVRSAVRFRYPGWPRYRGFLLVQGRHRQPEARQETQPPSVGYPTSSPSHYRYPALPDDWPRC